MHLDTLRTIIHHARRPIRDLERLTKLGFPSVPYASCAAIVRFVSGVFEEGVLFLAGPTGAVLVDPEDLRCVFIDPTAIASIELEGGPEAAAIMDRKPMGS